MFESLLTKGSSTVGGFAYTVCSSCSTHGTLTTAQIHTQSLQLYYTTHTHPPHIPRNISTKTHSVQTVWLWSSPFKCCSLFVTLWSPFFTNDCCLCWTVLYSSPGFFFPLQGKFILFHFTEFLKKKNCISCCSVLFFCFAKHFNTKTQVWKHAHA